MTVIGSKVPSVSQCLPSTSSLPPPSERARTNSITSVSNTNTKNVSRVVVPNVSPCLQSRSCLPPPSVQVHARPARVKTPRTLKLISRADLNVSGTPKIALPVPQPSAVRVLNCVTIPSTSRWLQENDETIEYSPFSDGFFNENNIDSIDDINVLD